jgi:pyrroloquinoline quinone biosynthesis protein D
MSAPVSDSVPRLRPGCRLSEQTGRESMLMIPEGALQLVGPALRIIQLCDGARTFSQIVDELCALHPAAPRDRIETDTGDLLETLRDKRAIDY